MFSEARSQTFRVDGPSLQFDPCRSFPDPTRQRQGVEVPHVASRASNRLWLGVQQFQLGQDTLVDL
jgi:hypothetical protein